MAKLCRTGLRGGGRGPSPRGFGSRWLVSGLLAMLLTGCATKGDLRDVRGEIRALADQQRETNEALSGMSTAFQDTLRDQSDALYESRGDIIRRLQEIEQELITLQELTGQNQRALTLIRDLLESQRAGGVPPTRTDPGPGQRVDTEFTPAGEQPLTSTAVDMYNMAATNLNRGNISTARLAFQDFLRQYPNDELAPDAHYFLADIMVREERYEEAIQAFLEIRSLFPESARVPRALYRVGTTYIALDQLEDARVYLERVVNTWPDSDAAALARERLDEIG